MNPQKYSWRNCLSNPLRIPKGILEKIFQVTSGAIYETITGQIPEKAPREVSDGTSREILEETPDETFK